MMENKTEQTPYKEERGFFKKHGRKIVRYTVAPVLFYGLFTFLSGMIDRNTPASYEEFNPRRREQVEEKEIPSLFKAIKYLGDNYNDEIAMVTNAPWRAMNVVTYERYNKVRKQAFEIAGVDEKNPEHDARRFEFYRQLGIAVRKTENMSEAAYIPFEKLKKYIEKNSTNKIDEKWKEYLNEEAYKGRVTLQGKAYYKADTDKNGIVTDEEWEKALHEMGYKPQKEVLEELTERLQGKNKEDLKKELETIIKESKENKDYLTGNIPKKIPISKLKEYAKQ